MVIPKLGPRRAIRTVKTPLEGTMVPATSNSVVKVMVLPPVESAPISNMDVISWRVRFDWWFTETILSPTWRQLHLQKYQ